MVKGNIGLQEYVGRVETRLTQHERIRARSSFTLSYAGLASKREVSLHLSRGCGVTVIRKPLAVTLTTRPCRPYAPPRSSAVLPPNPTSQSRRIAGYSRDPRP